MYTRILFLVSLLVLLSTSPGWAQSPASCTPVNQTEQPFSCSIQFTPQGPSTGVFDFSGQQDGILTFQFDTVLTTFTLTVTANEVTSVQVDPNSDIAGASCINYKKGPCLRYDVTGSGGAGLGGLPLRGTDYRGLITMTLNYDAFPLSDIPVFGHAPGDTNQIFSEDILTSYVDEGAPPQTSCNCEDPTMGGKTPGISSFAALHEPFPNNAQSLTVCPMLSALPQNSTSGNNPIVEVSFRLVAPNVDCGVGPYLRDKTATLTVGKRVTNGTVTTVAFVNLVNNGDANKFHFDNHTGLNVQDINANGLASGPYIVTVISQQFSPVTTTFTK